MDVVNECMKMISFGGEANSLSIKAIRFAKEKSFKKAIELLSEAKEMLKKARESHVAILTEESKGEKKIEISFFTLHAADHLNSGQVTYNLAAEIVDILRKEDENV